MSIHIDAGTASSIRSFAGRNGSTEHFIVVEPSNDGDFPAQLDSVTRRYAEALQSRSLAPDTAIFRRILLSDAVNQATSVRESSLAEDPASGPVAVSLIQQPPLPGRKIALVAYHIDGDPSVTKRQVSLRHVLVHKAGLTHLWSTRLRSVHTAGGASGAEDTATVLQQLVDALTDQGGTLAANCVRTWLYVKCVDMFYQDVVSGRTRFFARHGLTRDTHYIASTGIDGACDDRFAVVAMDAYSVLGLKPEQISYLNDFSLLCATKDYNVTFERGTRVGYADRAHSFISGTASIDSSGDVVHPRDVLRQLDRALVNVEGLLRAGGSDLGDMMHLMVYLRDATDFERVRDCLRERLPGMPLLIVQAPVCRPEWLIEVEGVAIAADERQGFPEF